MQWAAVLLQSPEVTLRIVGLTSFPTRVVDADEFEGQRAVGLVVAPVMAAFVLSVIASGPRLLSKGAAGIFVKTLAAELGTAPTNVNGFGGAALSDHGSHAIELGHFGGAAKALPISTKGNQEPGS